jgi:hypothetical protein
MKIFAAICILATIAISATIVFAQAPPEATAAAAAPPAAQDDAEFFRALAERLRRENIELRRRVEGLDAPLYLTYVDTKQREYRFQSEMMDMNVQNFRHQRIAAYVVLVMVVGVVGAGLWFAYMQLAAGLGPVAQAAKSALEAGSGALAARPPESAAAATAPGSPTATAIEASLTKVTITTSVVGIIVLLISLAFLYLYIKEVYEIRIIDPYRPTILTPDDGGQDKTDRRRPAEGASPGSSSLERVP